MFVLFPQVSDEVCPSFSSQVAVWDLERYPPQKLYRSLLLEILKGIHHIKYAEVCCLRSWKVSEVCCSSLRRDNTIQRYAQTINFCSLASLVHEMWTLLNSPFFCNYLHRIEWLKWADLYLYLFTPMKRRVCLWRRADLYTGADLYVLQCLSCNFNFIRMDRPTLV